MGADVYEQIRDEIVSGELAAGATLVETVLATRYGTSRTPIREALRRLEQDGLVERAARGLRVRHRSVEEILEIYEVRIQLEAAAARAAAERHTQLDLMRIRRGHDQMTAADVTDPTTMATMNRRFHESIWTASHNATLFDLLTRLHSHLTRYPATTLTRPGRWKTALAEHEQIIEAVTARDTDTAARLAEEHMTEARDIRLQMYSDEDIL